MAKINVWNLVRKVLRIILFIAKEKSENNSSNGKKKAKTSEKNVDIV